MSLRVGIWQKSSRSLQVECVELKRDAASIAMRDSKNPDPELQFSLQSWRGFIAGVKADEFDGPRSAVVS